MRLSVVQEVQRLGEQWSQLDSSENSTEFSADPTM